eukprot:5160493-Pyramimonas_sp.AAC.1
MELHLPSSEALRDVAVHRNHAERNSPKQMSDSTRSSALIDQTRLLEAPEPPSQDSNSSRSAPFGCPNSGLPEALPPMIRTMHRRA